MSRPPARKASTARSMVRAISARAARTAAGTVASSAFIRSTMSRDDPVSIPVVRGLRRSVRRGSRNSGVVMWLAVGGRLNYKPMKSYSQMRGLVAGFLLLASTACGHAGKTGPLGFVPTDWPLFASVKPVSGAKGMVVSGSPLASQVGADILQRGGNAVDAAVAVGFALAVVH